MIRVQISEGAVQYLNDGFSVYEAQAPSLDESVDDAANAGICSCPEWR
jgi:hypothetical protein